MSRRLRDRLERVERAMGVDPVKAEVDQRDAEAAHATEAALQADIARWEREAAKLIEQLRHSHPDWFRASTKKAMR